MPQRIKPSAVVGRLRVIAAALETPTYGELRAIRGLYLRQVFCTALLASAGMAMASDAIEIAAGNVGMRAAIDVSSGQLIEPLEPDAPASAGTQAPTAPAFGAQDFERTRIEALPDGRTRAHLHGQFDMASFARIDAEGEVATWCAPAATTPATGALGPTASTTEH